MSIMHPLHEAVNFIQSQYSTTPQYGIILGTGLGALTNDIDIEHIISYAEIPHFPVSTVESHSGKLIFGTLAGKQVVVMQGRFHYYEGYTMQQVTFPVRVMKLLGIQKLFISNAAGGLNPAFEISDLMVIEDHINFQPANPLVGQNFDELGPRFPDMLEPYDRKMVDQALTIGKEKGINIHEGVYVSVAGPNLETRAEYRMLRTMGADAVGMSTVPENLVAVQMGLPCFAVSVITDMCTPERLRHVTVEEVIAAAVAAEPSLTALMRALIAAQD